MATSIIDDCGTFPVYEAHRRRGEATCETCRRASNERMAAYQAQKGRHESELTYGRARVRAIQRLIDRHSEPYVRRYRIAWIELMRETRARTSPGWVDLPRMSE